MAVAAIAAVLGGTVVYWAFMAWVSVLTPNSALPLTLLLTLPAILFALHRVGIRQFFVFSSTAAAACLFQYRAGLVGAPWEIALRFAGVAALVGAAFSPVLLLYGRWPIHSDHQT